MHIVECFGVSQLAVVQILASSSVLFGQKVLLMLTRSAICEIPAVSFACERSDIGFFALAIVLGVLRGSFQPESRRRGQLSASSKK